ncbi:hypothetical protein BAUCODRAFT_38700 [Baudoinia panamericana UAMH 10762]|uniref:Uncharacterized protein n=1 Tax=Baudoinia panamericana (strain UAMH 10762) TaxID=717646 RepID=M2LCC3_BAUPA|nr:uncharacterized protein BAUCODRAFT_38700 [Baudoinia panamericana UAMH 10762]EMC91592.1 hypothetical protein BAUCODRAFT_38700 [Baudoinia panamericana UAMH 10762]
MNAGLRISGRPIEATIGNAGGTIVDILRPFGDYQLPEVLNLQAKLFLAVRLPHIAA